MRGTKTAVTFWVPLPFFGINETRPPVIFRFHFFEKRHAKPNLAGGACGDGSMTLLTCSALIPQPLSVIVMVKVSCFFDSATCTVISDAPARTGVLHNVHHIQRKLTHGLRCVFCKNLIHVLGNETAVNVFVDGEDRVQRPQAPMQRHAVSENTPSGVHSSGWMPSFATRRSRTLSAPLT